MAEFFSILPFQYQSQALFLLKIRIILLSFLAFSFILSFHTQGLEE
jgi:hypothetical protein